MASMGWRGVDLDGTLARYDGWKGDFNIGSPIEPMVKRIKEWLAAGWEVKIVTARASEYDPKDRAEVVGAIQRWCKEHIGQALEVTNQKDYAMVELWDDRAIQVVPNTGIAIQESLANAEKEYMALSQKYMRLVGALRGALGKEADQILDDLNDNG